MAMVKIIDPSGWNFDRPVAQLVKVSSRGLTGQDRSDFIKIASPVFLNLIDNMKLASDEVPVHVIAMGASEAYGSNRNGDGFKEAMLRRCHPTFEKYARWFRNHDNKSDSKFYGKIAKAAYNEDMRRVELLAVLNASKAAADRNGGYVADRELQRIKMGEDIPVSMAIRVPFDTCSSCGNQAKTRDDYCVDKTCVGPNGEKRGGCKHNLTKVSEDGHILHVDNPDGTFFDISDVFRPADRIAYGGRADYLQKAASHQFMPGAELADALGVTAPLDVIMATDLTGPLMNTTQVKLAYGLAGSENGPQMDRSIRMALDPAVMPALSAEQLQTIGQPGTKRGSEGLGALADKRIFLSLTDFARWVGKEAAAAEIAHLGPRLYNDLVAGGNLDHQMSTNPFNCNQSGAASSEQQKLARSLEPTHSLGLEAIQARAMKASLRNINPAPKQASAQGVPGRISDETRQVARAYGLYKLAALHRVASFDTNFNLTVRLALAQNGV